MKGKRLEMFEFQFFGIPLLKSIVGKSTVPLLNPLASIN